MKKEVLYSEEVNNFLMSLAEKPRTKILYNISLVAHGVVDSNLFKKLGDTGIWEFRTLYAGIWYRILAFWDTETGALIVTTHGFCKKTNKTPAKEIKRAIAIQKEYCAKNHHKS